MRVPIPVVIMICLIAVVVVWLLGTNDKDFTTPPTPQDFIAIQEEWERSRPNIEPPKPINANPLTDQEPTGSASSADATKPVPEKLPTGNLAHSPALSEYGTYGNKGAAAMVQLATRLETKGELQRALLAWERVIDTAGPSDEERQLAVIATKRLKSTLPPWNPDPIGDIHLTLHAGATLKDKKPLEDALSAAADVISDASGNIIKVSTKASIGKSRGMKTPRVPIAIWFSRPGKTPSDPRAETPPISFMADPGQKEMLTSQIEAGVYALLRAHLASETSFSPLPEYPAGVKPDELLKQHVTRLMWREFVSSMKE